MITKKISLRLLTTLVLAYLVLAFAWWAIQLWQLNDKLLAATQTALELKYGANKRGINLTEFEATAEYQALVRHHRRHRRMVLAEGIFFTGCLAFGLSVINRAAKRQVVLARQHRNFLLSITHELKSPIASIQLALETLVTRDLQREQIDKLCRNGLRDSNRLQNLVEGLLLAARIEDNWRPLPEPVDLLRLAQDCAANMQRRFPEANIEISIPKEFPLIQADKSGLATVLQNLLENALKYSPPGVPVRLSAKGDHGKWQLLVADEGIGIPQTEKSAVFEKFYRIGNEETRQTTGTGLGLYIVKHIVEAHGWHISAVDNQPGGTIFIIELHV